MTPNSNALHTQDDMWHNEDPRYDRAAGAWLGAAWAACLVGAEPPVITELAHPAGHSGGAALLSQLIDTALRDVRTPGTIAASAPAAGERAWAQALRDTIATGTVPARDAAVPESSPLATAWQAVLGTPIPRLDPARRVFPCSHLAEAAHSAHAAGGDEAAMYAGALAGARWGASAVPLQAHRRLADIVDPGPILRRAVVLARGSAPSIWPEQEHHYEDRTDPSIARPFRAQHPHDHGLTLANLSHMRADQHTEAVVSLCRIGTADTPARVPPRDRVEVWLIDTDGANPNLHFVIDEAARMVAALRGEGKRVLLHCAAGQSRTPAVAAHYAALACGTDAVQALRTIIPALGGHLDTPELSRTVAALNGVGLADPARELFPQGVPPRRHQATRG
ncbi:putative protein tyrosine phosphatase [Lipingzhangella halophila]|uniref:Tyrosine specific protein phosphatases domain-containing protein n=1 Tax=Lipingzhangella halophila TaxID=1783352 RepID=A0A7W7RHE9_9ACTN|nr:dual specificity protein phosphatase family protein [Lipingzhangella halophila]MBB4931955.1 putative protein tyrosine phosphatase [Lipingzhangella halophila]